MAADARLAPFTMLGAPDAAACEGDACVIPGASGRPAPADAAAATSAE
jgi:hypothetical protein